eukprot:CAMPEP_0197621510 /NCGR_PEP_ID=MMETSP1338-20131121/2089_1 /TAXON_ID=43686 ORGANISM="Pelagodinium beii, Strain RCC1491" /NCGR_SAMPLE_ID=MMETSP1338 /ASSEMBLY_ACC=CAM_ASM_000754 /LENGTH=677 /DNA_ID=CAMNT_0043191013 /DNA_START=62 /DNA_END=2095 /DNA_ORIENTATION=-
MKFFAMLVSAFAALAMGLDSIYQMDYSAETSPVRKVVEMMNKMVAQGEKEMQDEKLQFATYSQWCEMTKEKKTASIESSSDKIDQLKADIKKAAADIDTLTEEIDSHQKDMDESAAEQARITEVRDTEHADFKAQQKDYAESIDATSRAVSVLKKQAYDRAQASEATEESLLELPELKAPKVKQAVLAFIQTQEKQLPEAPKVDGYEFQSQGVITMLSELQDKFQAQKVELEKDEAEKKAAFDQTLQGLKIEEEAEKKDRDKKSGFKSKKITFKADSEDSLEKTEIKKKETTEYLDEISTTCAQKATDFDARLKLRTEELEAVEKAIGIIDTEDVAGNEKKHLAKSFIQVQSVKTALAFLRSGPRPIQEKVAAFLEREGERLHSATLTNLAAPVVNNKAMTQIKELLQGLVDKLQKQALDEQKKKDWCDKELSTNKMERKEKTASVEELQADMDRLQASVKQLLEEKKELEDDVAALDKSVAEATEIRNKEKAKNNATIMDAQAAQAAVASATSVLKEFYEKAGQATALVQEAQPAIFDSPYQGMGQSGGVVNMLEVIAADFAKLESETTSEEESSEAEYTTFMKDSKFNKKEMTLDIKHKKETATEQKADYEDKKTELEGEEKELDAANAVFDNLKDECINTAKSYEEEQKQRAETIESLQRALEMLQNNPTGEAR